VFVFGVCLASMGVIALIMAVIVLIIDRENGAKTRFIVSAALLFFGALFMTLDFKDEKSQPVLVETNETNETNEIIEIPTEQENPEEIEIMFLIGVYILIMLYC
jgi:apolipoprotein N-acyltransferase